MFNIDGQPRLQNNAAARMVHYLPFVTLKNNLALGLSKQSDNSTDAFGTLYPTSFNNASGVGSVQTLLSSYFATEEAGKGFDYGTVQLANNATKYVTGENYFSKYKRIKTANVVNFTKNKVSVALFTAGIAINNVIGIEAIDTTRFLVAFTDANGRELVVATVAADGSITFGAVTNFGGATTPVYNFGMKKINTDKIIMCYPGTRAANTAGTYATVITFSGTTITLGTETAAFNGATSGQYITVLANGTDKVQVNFLHSSTYITKSLTISGTTPTLGNNLSVNGTGVNYFGMVQITTDKFLAVYHKTSPNVYGQVISVATTTSSAGTELIITTTGGNWKMNSLYMIGSARVVVMVDYNYGFFCDVSGTTFTVTAANMYGFNSTNWPTSSTFNYIQEVTAGTLYNLYMGVNGEQGNSNSACLQFTISGNTITCASGSAMAAFMLTNNARSLDPLAGNNGNIVMGTVGTKVVSLYLLSTALGQIGYSSTEITSTFDAYNDATLIASFTHSLPFGGQKIAIDSAVTTGKKVYLGIKNTSGASKCFIVDQATVEVE